MRADELNTFAKEKDTHIPSKHKSTTNWQLKIESYVYIFRYLCTRVIT